MHRIKISNRRATQRCNVSSFFYSKICSLLARSRSSQSVQRVYWPENVIDWLGKWRPTCVMRHARGQKLQSFRRKWPFYMDLYSMLLCAISLVCIRQEHKSPTKLRVRTRLLSSYDLAYTYRHSYFPKGRFVFLHLLHWLPNRLSQNGSYFHPIINRPAC